MTTLTALVSILWNCFGILRYDDLSYGGFMVQSPDGAFIVP